MKFNLNENIRFFKVGFFHLDFNNHGKMSGFLGGKHFIVIKDILGCRTRKLVFIFFILKKLAFTSSLLTFV